MVRVVLLCLSLLLRGLKGVWGQGGRDPEPWGVEISDFEDGVWGVQSSGAMRTWLTVLVGVFRLKGPPKMRSARDLGPQDYVIMEASVHSSIGGNSIDMYVHIYI